MGGTRPRQVPRHEGELNECGRKGIMTGPAGTVNRKEGVERVGLP